MSDDKTETRFEEQGSLEPPRIIGRLVRLAVGAWLLMVVFPIYSDLPKALGRGLPLGVENLIGVAVMFWLLPYVVNIGWSVNTRRWPQILVALVSAGLAAVDYATSGVFYGQYLSVFTLVWLLYAATHLGVSFVLAALIATPGCEMRAIPHVWALVTGRRTKEHYCPGPFDRIDRWERGQDSGSPNQS